MTTITKEFAQAIIKGHGYGVAPSAVEELARIALASMEAEPVAYLNRFTGRSFELEQQPGADKDPDVYIPLYAAPPVPATEHSISENSVHDLFLRAKALMYQSGGSPIEHSLNPVDAWLFEAERCNSAGATEKCRSGENVQEVPPVCRRAPAWTGANCVDPKQCYIAGWNACRAAMLKISGE